MMTALYWPVAVNTDRVDWVYSKFSSFSKTMCCISTQQRHGNHQQLSKSRIYYCFDVDLMNRLEGNLSQSIFE